MYEHLAFGSTASERKKMLGKMIRSRKIRFGGNKKLKIYGMLSCSSGKRMSINNRVFFRDEKEAKENGFRPCGHCMREQYKSWKTSVEKA